MIIFTLSKSKFAQAMYYLQEIDHNENINKEVLYTYCKMNASCCIEVEEKVNIKPFEEGRVFNFNLSKDDKVICIQNGED